MRIFFFTETNIDKRKDLFLRSIRFKKEYFKIKRTRNEV